MPPHSTPPTGSPALQSGDLLPVMYKELRRLAGSLVGGLPPGQTLQPTALVHEAYLRLVRNEAEWANPRHFFGAAAQAMREIIIEQARRKGARKRSGGKRIELDETVCVDTPSDDILAVDEVIEQLRAEDDRLAELVILRFYAGLTLDEIAAVVGRSERTLKRDWQFAKAWLRMRLADTPPDAVS